MQGSSSKFSLDRSDDKADKEETHTQSVQRSQKPTYLCFNRQLAKNTGWLRGREFATSDTTAVTNRKTFNDCAVQL
jgi:hypothetical protein